MTQQYPIIVISGDVDGDGSDETGIFEMPDSTVTPLSRSQFLAKFGGGGGVAGAVAAKLLNKGDQVAIDGGAGPRSFEIEFNGWTGSEDYQWGSSSSTGVSKSSATGADRTSQACIFNEYVNRIDIGSNSPAGFYWGEYSDTGVGPIDTSSGVYSSLSVAIPEVQLPVPHNETSSSYSGSITVLSVEDLDQILDGEERTG